MVRVRLPACCAAVILLTAALAPAAAAAVIQGAWATGHGIYCDYGNRASSYQARRAGGSVQCSGYPDSRHRSLVFTLAGRRTLEYGRTIGQPPEATRRPPARWFHITAGLACRRGPGAILVQCHDRRGSFALSARDWTGRQLQCSIAYGSCGMTTVGSEPDPTCRSNGGAPLPGQPCPETQKAPAARTATRALRMHL